MSKRVIIWISIAVGVIVGCCAMWQIRNAKVSGPAIDERVSQILKSVCSLETTNSWHTVNASGGLVGSPFYSVRWWREYFVQREADVSALEALSSELGSRHSRVDFSFLPSGYASTILPHRDSVTLAPWWQPESNAEPMFMSASFGEGGLTVYLYGYKKATNGLLYIHIIQR
jgi:hypothetical protein